MRKKHITQEPVVITPFEKLVSEILGYSVKENLVVEWRTGGISGGSHWDEGEGDDPHYAVDGDPEPTFDAIDKVLTALCPTITFLQYKKLEQELIERDSRNENEYYGNCTYYGIKKINLNALQLFLLDNNIWSIKEQSQEL